MKARSRYIFILSLVFGYVLLQFVWWEILLVRQAGRIVNEEQKLLELSTSDQARLRAEIVDLHHRKKMQILMIVGEGTVFLLLLLYGVQRIRRAYEKETALNRQQSNFLLSITHELKTPIAATKLQLQTLQKQKLDEATRNGLLADALAETERLNLLIDNVLLASSLDNGQLNMRPAPLDLSHELQVILNRYYKQQLTNGELIVEIDAGLSATADAGALPSVVTNLVGNAIKYSGADKKIVVSLKRAGSFVRLAVADQGIGISESDKKKVFERFYRAGNEETRSAKGTGLGLFIVKYIADGHNAALRVKDNQPRGSIFEMDFHAV